MYESIKSILSIKSIKSIISIISIKSIISIISIESIISIISIKSIKSISIKCNTVKITFLITKNLPLTVDRIVKRDII